MFTLLSVNDFNFILNIFKNIIKLGYKNKEFNEQWCIYQRIYEIKYYWYCLNSLGISPWSLLFFFFFREREQLENMNNRLEPWLQVSAFWYAHPYFNIFGGNLIYWHMYNLTKRYKANTHLTTTHSGQGRKHFQHPQSPVSLNIHSPLHSPRRWRLTWILWYSLIYNFSLLLLMPINAFLITDLFHQVLNFT